MAMNDKMGGLLHIIYLTCAFVGPYCKPITCMHEPTSILIILVLYPTGCRSGKLHDELVRAYIQTGAISQADMMRVCAIMGWVMESRTVGLYLRDAWSKVLQTGQSSIVASTAPSTAATGCLPLEDFSHGLQQQLACLSNVTAASDPEAAIATQDTMLVMPPACVTASWRSLRSSDVSKDIAARALAAWQLMAASANRGQPCAMAEAREARASSGSSVTRRPVQGLLFSRDRDLDGLQVRMVLNGAVLSGMSAAASFYKELGPIERVRTGPAMRSGRFRATHHPPSPGAV